MAVFVYMLRCRDGSYYVGSANQLERRLGEHQTGVFGGYTSSRLPVDLVWSEEFEHASDAIAAERQIKGWSRAKKEALINGDWAAIVHLSKRRGAQSRSSS
jgi:putative endonuclease